MGVSKTNDQIKIKMHPQKPQSGLKGHGCSLHFQNQDRELKFGIWFYLRPVTISKAETSCQTPVRNLKRNNQD